MLTGVQCGHVAIHCSIRGLSLMVKTIRGALLSDASYMVELQMLSSLHAGKAINM